MLQLIPNTPNDLLEIDTSVFVVNMAYDFNANGIYITKAYKTTTGDNDAVSMTSYYFDLENGGWWKDLYPAVDRPYSLLTSFGTASTERGVLFGCRDGYVRIVKDSNTTDNIGATDTEIPSYVVYGPFMLGGGSYGEGLLAELTPILGNDTAAYVVISAAFGDTAELATLATYQILDIVAKGRGKDIAPRMGNSACCIKVASTASSPITATGVYDGSTYTVITSSAAFFCSAMVGKTIVVADTGTYAIAVYTSTTSVKIAGNTAFTDKLFSVAYGAWAIEELLATLRVQSKKRIL